MKCTHNSVDKQWIKGEQKDKELSVFTCTWSRDKKISHSQSKGRQLFSHFNAHMHDFTTGCSFFGGGVIEVVGD